jgi:ribosomal protein L36
MMTRQPLVRAPSTSAKPTDRTCKCIRRTPVVFVHDSGCSRAAGTACKTNTPRKRRGRSRRLAGKSIGDVADHIDEIIRRLDKKPARSATLRTPGSDHRRTRARAAVTSTRRRSAASSRPISALRSASPVLAKPRTGNRAVPHLRAVPRASRTLSARRRQRSSTRPTRFPAQANRSSRRQRRTSTPGVKRRSIRRTPTADPC